MINSNSLNNSASITKALGEYYYPNSEMVVKSTSFSTEGVLNRPMQSTTVSDAMSGDRLYRNAKFSLTFYNRIVNSSLNSLVTGGAESVHNSPTMLKIKNPESLVEDGAKDTPAEATLTGGAAINRIIANTALSRKGGSDFIDIPSAIALADMSNIQKNPEYIAAMAHGDNEYVTDVAMVTSGSRTIALASQLTDDEKGWLLTRAELLKSKGVVTDGKYLTKGFPFDIPNGLQNLKQTKTYYEGMERGDSVEQALVDAAVETAYICPAMIELLLFLESKTTYKGALGAEKAKSSTGQTISNATATSGSSLNDHVFGRAFDLTLIESKDGSISVDIKNEGNNVSKYRTALTHFLEILNASPSQILPDLIVVHSDLAPELGIVVDNEPVEAPVKKQYPNLKYINFRADPNHRNNIHFSFSAQRSGQYIGAGGALGTPGQFLSPAPEVGNYGPGTPADLSSPRFKQSYANNTSGTLTLSEIYDLLRGTVMSDEAAAIFVAVSVRESGARPAAFNPNANSGDWSIGMFQVNFLTNAHGGKTFYFPVGRISKPGWQLAYKDWQKDGVNAGNFNTIVKGLYNSIAGDHNAKVMALMSKIDPACFIPFNQAYMVYTCITGQPGTAVIPPEARLGSTPENAYIFSPWGDYGGGPVYGFISNVDFKDALDVYRGSGKSPATLKQWVLSMFASSGRASKSAQYASKWVDGWFYPCPWNGGWQPGAPVQRHTPDQLYPAGGGSGVLYPGSPSTPGASRPYTGWNGDSSGVTPGLQLLIDSIISAEGGKVWNNGSWGVRDMRGKSSPSVHGTGRAVDLSWRVVAGKGGSNYDEARRIMDWLVAHESELGLEMIIDYYPGPHGRGWRCDRQSWMNYESYTVAGAPGGDWFHIEISPALASNPAAMQAGIDKALRSKNRGGSGTSRLA